MRQHNNLQNLQNQRGMSLVELLVSLAIGLIIALVAATAYLGARSTSTAIANISTINETGKQALDVIGRDLQMAGYYPAIISTTAGDTNNLGRFTNTKNTGAVAYNQGLFGCSGALFNPVTRACEVAVAGAPDSVVINYFAIPELDATTFVSGFDCLRQPVSADTNNAGQILNNRPLYVSNRFGLIATNYTAVNGAGAAQAVVTNSIACNGNGLATEVATYQPLFDGIQDLVIRYGAHAGTGNLSPERYYTATEIGALVTVNGLTGWQRVSSVKVCVLTRTKDNMRNQDKAGELRSYTDCRGNAVTYAANDRTLSKTFERVFAIRNNLTGIY